MAGQLTEQETKWLMQQRRGVRRFFLGFSVFCIICFAVFLFAYFDCDDPCMKRIWGYRAFLFFMLGCCSIGTRQLVDRYIKIIDKLSN